jgi:CTP-dependent riboflavin kinase
MLNDTIIELKKLLTSMEEDFGLNELSEVERNVLYAIKDLQKKHGTAKTGEVLSHTFTSSMSRISVFRSLKTLEQLELIRRNSSKRGEYILS